MDKTKTNLKLEQASIRIAEEAESIRSKASVVIEKSSDGMQMSNNVSDSMTEIQARSNHVKESTASLISHTNEIAQALEMIKDIAAQTNLLSINVAIAAANATGGGAEFSVLAREIRSLANDSKENAQIIETILTTIQNGVKDTVESMQMMEKSVEIGTKAFEGATEIFTTINQSATKNVGLSESIVSSSTDIQKLVREHIDDEEPVEVEILESMDEEIL